MRQKSKLKIYKTKPKMVARISAAAGSDVGGGTGLRPLFPHTNLHATLFQVNEANI